MIKYEMLKKIVTVTVEYAYYGGEKDFIKEENVLADTFSEAERKLAVYLEGQEYRIISYCWIGSVIDDAYVIENGLPNPLNFPT